MCGIAAVVDPKGLWNSDELRTRLEKVLHHRGPDGFAGWNQGPVSLFHWRLAVIDTTETGDQPMHARDGRYSIVFNGEIYNYLVLRRELEHLGWTWRGTGDTEVMLAAISQWGLKSALERADGMFAIALWDHDRKSLTLARDRFGEKPMYYGSVGGALCVASELKVFRALRGFDPALDPDAIAQYVRFQSVPAPKTIYRDVAKLPPGAFVEIALSHVGSTARDLPQPTSFWSPSQAADRARRAPFTGTRAEAGDRLEEILKTSVATRMLSDVPLGAFLSGGIDSSTVVALMAAQASGPVQTYTIGYAEDTFSEATFAAEVARILGTKHEERIVSPVEALNVVPRLGTMYDEPFSDSSQIPTHLVSETARRSVTVALAGDGGDELFGGYERYFAYGPTIDRIHRVPALARRPGARLLSRPSASTWNRLARPFGKVTSRSLGHVGETIHHWARATAAPTLAETYDRTLELWEPESILTTDYRRDGRVDDPTVDGLSTIEQLMLRDTQRYLPEDILTKVDRASMAVSLEVRAPFLNADLFAFAWSLPLEFRAAGGVGKLLVRDVLARHLPTSVFERPKMGFALPVQRWLRSDLRPWAEDLLNPSRLRNQGIFSAELVDLRWRQQCAGTADWSPSLWNILMFQAWWDTWMQ